MFVLNDDMSIYATRGDTVFFTVTATDGSGANYKFKPEDVVRFKAFEKKACENVVAQKDFVITEETEEVNILLTEDDTRFGKIISKPRDYWYEIELNPFTNPQTIIGYDDDGPKVFRLYPESKNIVKDISEEDFYADAELSPTSTNPIQNQAVTRAVANLSKYVDDELKNAKENALSAEEALRIRGELRRLDAEVTQQKSDFNEHKSAKNPHGTTASDVGALPDTGGTLSGTLGVLGGTGVVTGGDTSISLLVKNGEVAQRSLSLNYDMALKDALILTDFVGSETYNVYGEHNKPSGSYVGNGDETVRTINIGGIGECLFVKSSLFFVFVTAKGAFCVQAGTKTETLASTVAKFENGVLTLALSSAWLNKNGSSYNYCVL